MIALSSNVSSSEQQAAPTPAGLYNALYVMTFCKNPPNSQHPTKVKPGQEALGNECKGCVGLERDLLTRSWLQQNDDAAARYDNADF